MKPVKRTKIIATVSSNVDSVFIRALYDKGVNVIRLNTAHMEVSESEAIVKAIRDASKHIGILIDTKGPEVRTADMSEPMTVLQGEMITVSASPDLPPERGFAVNYKNFVHDVDVGHHMLIDDGDIDLMIREKKSKYLVCEVICPGVIKNRKTVNVPDCELHMPSLTPKDRAFIEFAIEHELDFIAHSFVRKPDDIVAVRSILDTYQSPIKIIAKIENRQGFSNIDAILECADGIMVARGDLGVEIPAEEVPGIQKQMIYKAICSRKPVITATQMLQSMIEKPRPTRAEVSDVANAVLDGSDAVMLSGETAQGKYPFESVEIMSKIIVETERSCGERITRPLKVSRGSVSDAFWQMAKSAASAAEALGAKAVICNTMTGESARLIAAYRSHIPIYALTFNDYVQRQLAVSYGVYTNHNPYAENPDEIALNGVQALLDRGKLAPDDLVVIIGNFSADKQRGINYMTISTPQDMVRSKQAVIV